MLYKLLKISKSMEYLTYSITMYGICTEESDTWCIFTIKMSIADTNLVSLVVL